MKNTSIWHKFFQQNCGYYDNISYKEDMDPHLQLGFANETNTELQELIAVCKDNL